MPLVRLHCTPAVEPNACVVHAMGSLLPAAPTLTFDDTIGAAKMPVRFRERLETDDLHVELWPTVAGSEPPPGTAALVLGHQQDARGAMPCPATASVAQPPAPRLAAVALAMDPVRQCVLLTRRPRSMRTFPGAWVLPGGSVDATDGSTAAAALRELAEETGLAASEAVGVCLPATQASHSASAEALPWPAMQTHFSPMTQPCRTCGSFALGLTNVVSPSCASL